MGLLQEFLIAFRAFEWILQAVGFHVRVQLGLLFERLLRTTGAIVAGDARMRLQMLVQ